jgi:nucleoside-diphosphate-sugar epimerase
MVKTLLISGATGFTGSHILNKAESLGYKTTAIIRRIADAKKLNSRGIETILLNENFEDSLKIYKETFGQPDLILHNAGLVRGNSQKEMAKSNIEFTQYFIESLEKTGIKGKKFIFISSIAAQGPCPENIEYLTEESETRPVTIYGKTKLQAENYIRQNRDLSWIIIRPTAIYGPGDKDGLVIYKAIKYGIAFRLAREIQYISLLFVEDFADAIFHIAANSPPHETYILTDGNNYQSMEYTNLISEKLNNSTLKIYIPQKVAILAAILAELKTAISKKQEILSRDKLKELTALNWRAKSTKIEGMIGFKANTNMEVGVTKTIKWYKENGWI